MESPDFPLTTRHYRAVDNAAEQALVLLRCLHTRSCEYETPSERRCHELQIRAACYKALTEVKDTYCLEDGCFDIMSSLHYLANFMRQVTEEQNVAEDMGLTDLPDPTVATTDMVTSGNLPSRLSTWDWLLSQASDLTIAAQRSTRILVDVIDLVESFRRVLVQRMLVMTDYGKSSREARKEKLLQELEKLNRELTIISSSEIYISQERDRT